MGVEDEEVILIRGFGGFFLILSPSKCLLKGWQSFDNIIPEVVAILQEYEHILQYTEDPILLPEIVIDKGDSVPKWSQPYQTIEYKTNIIKQQCKAWLQEGVIEHSTSPWASPVVFMSQATASGEIKHSLCRNFKKVNECIQRQNFPLHRTEDLMDRMRGSVKFTIIYLQSSYLQLPL